MKKNTRFAFNAYLQQLARLNGVAVEELSSKFTVEPSVQQTLEDQIQQSAAFLTLINVTPVTEQSGQSPLYPGRSRSLHGRHCQLVAYPRTREERKHHGEA